MIACFNRRFCRYSSMFLETLCPLPCSSWPPIIPVNNILVACTFIPSCSCYYKIPLVLSVVSRILCAFCFVASFWIVDNSLNRGSFIPSCSYAFLNTWKYYLIFRKSSAAYCSWFPLPACIRINSICLAIFFKILCDCHFVPMDSACVRILAIINQSLEIFFPAQTSFEIWAGSCPI